MTNLFNLIINGISKRPTMYIGDKKLSTLNIYIMGYQVALTLNKVTESGPDFDDFIDWLNQKINNVDTSKSWVRVLLNKSKRNEEQALYLFFELITEYVNEHNFVIDE